MTTPYRAASVSCPRCATRLEAAGSRWSCPRCGGVWVGDAELIELVRAMAPDRRLNAVPFAPRQSAGPLPCPHCSAMMTPCRLAGVAVDRCAAELHPGVWFDHDELARTLQVTTLGYEPSFANVLRSLLGPPEP